MYEGLGETELSAERLWEFMYHPKLAKERLGERLNFALRENGT